MNLPTQKFSIGNFNLLNLQLPNIPFYGDRKYTPEIYQKKIQWIGNQLDKMKADIVGFQEAFSVESLQEAVNQSQYLQNAHCILSGRIEESPAVALASRFPIMNYEIIQEFPEVLDLDGFMIPITKFSRPILRAEIKINADCILNFFVAHLKSKRPIIPSEADEKDTFERSKGEARSLIRRTIEATALRAVLLKYLQNRDMPVIVVGDLNDNDLAVTTQIISGEPPFRHWEKELKKSVWDTLLYHSKALQARKSYHDFYYTHIHNGHYEALDHILVSQELVAENPQAIGKVVYVQTLNDHLIDETLSNDKVAPWQSDHAQVVVSLELKNINKE